MLVGHSKPATDEELFDWQFFPGTDEERKSRLLILLLTAGRGKCYVRLVSPQGPYCVPSALDLKDWHSAGLHEPHPIQNDLQSFPCDKDREYWAEL
jgi:hypothetical protein